MRKLRYLIGAVLCLIAIPFGTIGWLVAKIAEGFIDLGRAVAGEPIVPWMEVKSEIAAKEDEEE